MDISHAADPKESVCSSKVPSFESSRFESEMLVRWRKLEGWQADHFLRLRVFGFENDHRGESIWRVILPEVSKTAPCW